MKIVNGIFASAKIFTDDVEEYAAAQIKLLCDNIAAKGCVVRIMPDVHPGKVGVIGLTMTVGERLLPGLVGIDIGCGITITKVKQKKIEFQKLDTVIRENIPAGRFAKKKRTPFYEGVRPDKAPVFWEHPCREGSAQSWDAGKRQSFY